MRTILSSHKFLGQEGRLLWADWSPRNPLNNATKQNLFSYGLPTLPVFEPSILFHVLTYREEIYYFRRPCGNGADWTHDE